MHVTRSSILRLLVLAGACMSCSGERPTFGERRTANENVSGTTNEDAATSTIGETMGVDADAGPDGSSPPAAENGCRQDEYWDGAGANARCRPLTQCPPGKSVSIEATKTSDRVCSVCGIGRFLNDGQCTDYTACAEDEFESSPPTENKDRECEALTRCVEGQYVSKQATERSDRSCRSCSDGEFSDTINAETCLPFSECADDEVEKAPPTKSRDRTCGTCEGSTFVFEGTCKPYTECGSDEYETTPPGKTTDRICTSLTVCAEDEYEAVSPTENTDRRCALITTCVAGQYVGADPDETRDRECLPCPPETFSPVDNAETCTPWTKCAPGELESVAPTLERDRVCSGCPEGKYEADGDCVELTVCGESEYESRAARSDSDRRCSKLTECESDEYESVPHTSVRDRECRPLTSCVPGEYVETEPTKTEDRTCSPCPASSYSTQDNAVACSAWSACPEGWHELVLPSATADSTCTECVPGAKRCGNAATPQTCSESGAWTNDLGCGASSECTGDGVCKRIDGVECTSNAQCVSGACTTFYADADEDGFGSDGAPKAVCGTTPPADHVLQAGDCCDTDPRARPTNTSSYANANECGSFDYNCDGEAKPAATQVGSCHSHAGACNGSEGPSGWSGGIPACGESGSHIECETQGTAPSQWCGSETSRRVQSCR